MRLFSEKGLPLFKTTRSYIKYFLGDWQSSAKYYQFLKLIKSITLLMLGFFYHPHHHQLVGVSTEKRAGVKIGVKWYTWVYPSWPCLTVLQLSELWLYQIDPIRIQHSLGSAYYREAQICEDKVQLEASFKMKGLRIEGSPIAKCWKCMDKLSCSHQRVRCNNVDENIKFNNGISIDFTAWYLVWTLEIFVIKMS